MKLINQNSGETVKIDDINDFGLSFMFGPFWFLFRVGFGWFLLTILLNLFTMGFAWIPLCFFAHGIRKRKLFSSGWMTVEMFNRKERREYVAS